MPELKKFAVTFGVQYNRVGHPVDRLITGQTYFVIDAVDYDAAHREANRLFEGVFAFLYDWEEFIPQIDRWGYSEFKFSYAAPVDVNDKEPLETRD